MKTTILAFIASLCLVSTLSDMDVWTVVPLSLYFIFVYLVPLGEGWKPLSSWCYRISLWMVGLIFIVPKTIFFLLPLALAIGVIYPLLVLRVGGNQKCFWFDHSPITKINEKMNYSHLQCERCKKDMGILVGNLRKSNGS